MTQPEQTIIPEDTSKVKRWTFFRWFIRFVWAYFIFLVIILFSAFFLLLFDANAEVGIVEWIYRSADRAMEPFRGIFPTREAGQGSIIDFSILFAVIVYGIIAGLIDALINFIDRKIAEERQKALFINQETERRRQADQMAAAQAAENQRIAAQQAAATQLAIEQAAAQQRTADATEQLAAEQEPPKPPPVPPAPPSAPQTPPPG